jgi:branched-subunit amino acid ABC-type transport system permease component
MSLRRLLSVWLVLVVAMSANGIFRELVLRPRVGRSSADVLSAVLGIAIILVGTRYFLRPLAGRPTKYLAITSAALVALTVAFEFLFGHYVDHKSWEELAQNYALWRGRLWPILLLTLALTPFLWGRWLRAETGR